MDYQTDQLTMNQGSSISLMSVVLPASDFRRQTKPGAALDRVLISSNLDMEPSMRNLSRS